MMIGRSFVFDNDLGNPESTVASGNNHRRQYAPRMSGHLKGSEVWVDDQSEASQIHNKGYYGVPQSGGSLKLDLMEAVYLVESERLEIGPTAG